MQIREIKEEDNHAVGTLVQTVLKANGYDLPGTAYYDPHLFQLFTYYQQPKAQYWVIEIDGKVVGGIGVGPFNKEKGIGEIQKLYILEEAQGKGYSRKLMDRALSFAKDHYSACYIETFEGMKAANYLYQSYGFYKLDRPLEGTEHSTCDTWLLKE